MDTSPCEGVTTYMETTFSDGANICIDQPYEDSYPPVYSNLTRPHDDTYTTDPKECFIVLILGIAFVLLICKFNINIFPVAHE